EPVGLLTVGAAGEPVGLGREVEVLLHGQVRVQPRGGWHVPDALLRRAEHGAGADREEPDKHFEAGRLARAVPAHHDSDARRVNRHRDPGEDKIAPAGGVHVPQSPFHEATGSWARTAARSFRLPGARSRRNRKTARPRTATASTASSPIGSHRSVIGIAFSMTPRLISMK